MFSPVKSVRDTAAETLFAAVSARDAYTGEHTEEVVGLAVKVGHRLGVSGEALENIRLVALLHDVGKISTPDSILRKHGPLDDEEWQLMREHPIRGADLAMEIPELAHLAPCIRAEHERWDGTGYPDRATGEEIPLSSRITFVCDAYCAMVSDRPYRAAIDAEMARRELRLNAGTQFDPDVVEALLDELSHPN